MKVVALRRRPAGEGIKTSSSCGWLKPVVVSVEADLDRFRTWSAKIAARDYFAAPGGQDARDAVEEAAAELAAFEDAALHAEAPEPASASETPGLRVADQR
jgi:hypothetical protein